MEVSELSPFVYWAQTKDTITLRVDLRDVEDPDIDVSKEEIVFRALGTGARGYEDYTFHLNFYWPLDGNKADVNVTGRSINITIPKLEDRPWWPRLTREAVKLPWLKIDFDKWRSEEISDESADDKYERVPREQMKNFREELDMRNKRRGGGATKARGLGIKGTYLMLYSLFQLLAYTRIVTVILYRLVRHSYNDGGDDVFTHMFDTIGTQIMMCQVFAVLEIVHAFVGMVKSDIKAVMAQVFGRNLVLFLLIAPEPRMQEKPVSTALIFVWSISEVFRYPYYMLKLIKQEYYMVSWLRYSMWIPLYPLGFVLEGVILLRSLPYLMETGRYDLELPLIPLTLHFYHFIMVYMVILIPGGMKLMKVMYNARRRKLGARYFRQPTKTT